jgi:hypothetical protein
MLVCRAARHKQAGLGRQGMQQRSVRSMPDCSTKKAAVLDLSSTTLNLLLLCCVVDA